MPIDETTDMPMEMTDATVEPAIGEVQQALEKREAQDASGDEDDAEDDTPAIIINQVAVAMVPCCEEDAEPEPAAEPAALQVNSTISSSMPTTSAPMSTTAVSQEPSQQNGEKQN